MNTIIYLKAPQCIDVTTPDVTLGDFLTIYSTDSAVTKRLQSEPFFTFPQDKPTQLVVSVLKVLEQIYALYPDAEIENLGEGDFILSYTPQSAHSKCREAVFTCFICLVAFFGGGYAIMAYNTDVGAKELFANLSMLFLGNAQRGIGYIAASYAVGLTAGMLLFFNHLGNRKLSNAPTPLEIQMRLYEKDISTTVIKNSSRRHETLDISSSSGISGNQEGAK